MGDYIGFFIALFALFLSSYIKRREKKDREEHPEKYAEEDVEQGTALRDLLASLDLPLEEPVAKPKPPPPPRHQEPAPKPRVVRADRSTKRQVDDRFEFQSDLEDRHQESSITDRHLSLQIDEGTGVSHFDDAYANVPEAEVWDISESGGASRIHKLISGLETKRNAILLREVFGPPRANEPWV